MNVQRIKQQLDKVNSYYGFLIENQSNISRLDRDAFLAVIRGLYDACLDEEKTEATPQPQPTTPQPVKKEEKKKRPKLVFTTPTEETLQKEAPTSIEMENSHEPDLQTPPNKVDSITTPTSIIEEPISTPPQKEEPAPTPKKEVPKQEVPNSEPQEMPQSEPTDAENYEEYEELFFFKEATDLSQKLSTSPIEDLQKALGMNEKYLYINELFGGDVADFQTTLKKLNTAADFDQARRYLEQHCIGQYNWMEKNKKGTAKSFVKLVRRRHL